MTILLALCLLFYIAGVQTMRAIYLSKLPLDNPPTTMLASQQTRNTSGKHRASRTSEPRQRGLEDGKISS